MMALLLFLSFAFPEIGRVLPGATLAWILIGLATSLAGGLQRVKSLMYYGAVAAAAGVFAAAAADFGLIGLGGTLIGFGIFVGFGLTILGFAREKALATLGIFMMVGTLVQYFAIPSTYGLTNLAWLVLAGASVASFGYLKKSAFAYFLGIFFMVGVVSTFIIVGDYVLVEIVGFLIVAVGVGVSYVYMYRVLGRPPEVKEILTLAAQALFTYGLRKPLDQYRVVAIAVQGDIGTPLIVDELLSKLRERWYPIVMLGPTSPTEITLRPGAKIGWVTTLSGVAKEEYTVLSPSNPTQVNLFLSDATKSTPPGDVPVIIGDYLDNMIPFMREDSFYRYYSELASRIKVLNHTGVFIIKSDIHPEVIVNIVKQFADVIIENREREDRSRVIREVRVTNKADNFSTEWKKMPVPAMAP
jgi:hypothetical protein